MSAAICILCLIGAAVVLISGLARLLAPLRRIQQNRATRPIRDALEVAKARAEIEDRDYGKAVLDQQDMGEGWS